MPVFTTDFLGHCLQSVLLNASGVHCTTAEQLSILYKEPVAGVVSKSATLEPKTGNPKPRYWDDGTISINAMGLPNNGLDYYLKTAIDVPKNSDQLFILSVAGIDIEQNYDIFKKINAFTEIDAIELNLSCPNLPNHPIIAYNFSVFEKILKEVVAINKKPLGIKLPPYFESHQFDTVSQILNKSGIQFISTINSIPNALIIDIETETPVIYPKKGLGGLGGSFVKPTTLANIYQFHERLNSDISIIGCGGIQNGGDVFEHILCGASLVEIGTQLAVEGPAVFSRIQSELFDIMKQKNYKTIADFKGKLKFKETI